MLLYKPFHDISADIELSTEIIVENWRNFRYRAWHVDRNPSIDENIEDGEHCDFANQEMNLEDYFQEWQLFSHLIPPNSVNVSELHTLGRRDFDISFDWKGTTIYDDVAEEAINFIRNAISRGDVGDLSSRTFVSPDSLAKKQ